MKNIVKSGFTLIELLVVITIIGILATGGISVYTAQIEKARDTTRITDMKVLQGWVEQAYQDNSAYPNSNMLLTWATAWLTTLLDYLEDIPGDAKTGQTCNSSAWITVYCWYAYKAANSVTWITMWAFELSTAFENTANVTKKAVNTVDWWNSNDTLELWVDKDTIDSAYDTVPTWTLKYWACLETAVSAAANPTDLIIINWESRDGSNCSS